MTRRDRERRKQFSSCDTCRKSRVRCVSQDDSHELPDRPCAHCAKRGLPCTYDWLRSATLANQIKRKSQSGTEAAAPKGPVEDIEQPQPVQPTEEVDKAASTKAASDSGANDHDLHQALWSLFSSIFEPVFSVWLGADCCPYGQNSKVIPNWQRRN